MALWPALALAQKPGVIADGIKAGAALPPTCNPATSGKKADVFIKSGSSAGVYYCSAANTWTAVGGSSSSGDLVGPSSATDNAVARFDGTTGKLVQDSAVTIADTTGDITAGKYNKVTITAPATGSTLTILNGKTLTANNTLTLAGTDGSTLNVGAGGTLGTAAFTATSAYEVPLTFGNGVTRSTNAISLDQSFAATWTGQHIFNKNGALSSSTGPGITANGTWITGGSATTTKPYVLIETSGATSTAWSTSGTGLGVNAANAFAGNLLDLQLNGVSKFKVDAFGTIVASSAGITIGVGAAYGNGVVQLFSGGSLGWVSGSIPGTNDLTLRRSAAANLAFGAADAASPVAQTLSVQNVVTGTSNTAGTDWTFKGSQGTGTGAGGSIIFQTAPAGSTGTSVNALATALTINSAGALLLGGSTTTAVYVTGSKIGLGSTASTVLAVGVANDYIGFSVNADVGFSPGGASAAIDTHVGRAAAANWRHGAANAASPVAQTISTQGSRSGTDSNVGGANLTIQSGLGTGTGTLSSLILQSPIAVASGTGAQTATTGLTIIGGVAQLSAYTVATLPACSATTKGGMAYVTDATQTITAGIGATVAGSGANVVPVFCDGTNWLIN